MSKREYTWYVEPIGNKTNAVIHDYIKEKSIDAECRSIECADEKKHNLWRCDFDLIGTLHVSQKSLSLNFRVFNQQGKGLIRPCPSFLFEKKKRKKVKTAE